LSLYSYGYLRNEDRLPMKVGRPLRVLLYFAALAIIAVAAGFLLNGWLTYLAGGIAFVVMTVLVMPLALAGPERREHKPALASHRH
jgi:hypothetical protein